jgi:hypothetical protein
MKFVNKTFDLCHDGGYISLITPSTVIGSTQQPAKNRKRLSGDFSLESIDYSADDFFEEKVTICRWTASHEPYSGLTRVIENGIERTVDLRKELPLRVEAVVKNALAEKIAAIVVRNTTKKLNGFCEHYRDIEDGDIPTYWSGPNKIRSINKQLNNKGVLKVVVSFSASYSNWFITKSQATNFNKMYAVDSIEEGLALGATLSHPLIRFFADHWRKTAGFTPAVKNKNMLPDIRGLSDDEINSLFELTAEEISIIYANRKPTKDQPRVLSLTE